MKNVSQEWKDNIYALTRETQAVVTFPFIDPFAKDVAELNSLPVQSIISKQNQIIDDNTTQVGKVASFENDYWKLDGSFVLPRADTQSQYGFRGKTLSNSEGVYTSDNVLRFYFTQPITVPGYTIYFDEDTNNYLTDFDVVSYKEDMSVIRTVEVRGNKDAKCVVGLGSSDIKYLDIVFRKSSLPYRAVRIIEIDFGILLTFEGKNLFTLKLTSECDYLAETVPQNELVLSAFNGGEYDYTNPESYSKYLQERQKMYYTHKLKLPDGSWESVDMGGYLLSNWKVSDSKVEFTARADTYSLDDTIFPNSISQGLTAGAFMELIFSSCGVTDYEIPQFIYSSPLVTTYCGDKCSCKEAMRQLSSLCGCTTFVTQSGKVVVHKVDFENASSDVISYTNSLNAPDSSSTPYYNCIQLTVYTIEGDSISSVVESYDAPWRQSGEKAYPYKLDLKMCISDERWVALKPWLLEQKFRVLGLRLKTDTSWRQNPALELGDYVQIQLDKTGGSSPVFTQKHELSYTGGALKGNTVGIGSGMK